MVEAIFGCGAELLFWFLGKILAENFKSFFGEL
jgi:hypothetical protein